MIVSENGNPRPLGRGGCQVAMFYPKSEIDAHELAKAFHNDTIDYRKLVLKSYLREMDEAGLLGNQDGKSINLIRYLSLLHRT